MLNAKRAAVATLLMGIGGCASLSESQCQAGDWYSVGLRDGANGRDIDYVLSHGDACGQYGVTPDSDLWRSGYEAGLDSFCTPTSAATLGARGGNYGGACRDRDEGAFLNAYNDGLALKELEDAYRSAERALDDLEDDIDKSRDRIRKLEDDIDNANAAGQTRTATVLKQALKAEQKALSSLKDARNSLSSTARNSEDAFDRWRLRMRTQYDGAQF